MDLEEFLDLHGTISIPYKEKFDEFFSEIRAWKNSLGYDIQSNDCFTKFNNFDDFYKEFSSYFNNIGVLQKTK